MPLKENNNKKGSEVIWSAITIYAVVLVLY